jgi:hypothetical protein
LPGREPGARLQRVIAAEVRSKSPACCRLEGRSGGGALGRELRTQPLQARLITLLHALLALQQPVLRLQQPLLRALRPLAFRLLRLQLLHALLQAIDAALPFRVLARKHLALPPFDELLALLRTLLALKLPALRLEQPLLLALRPCAFRLLRLQLLHALLQAVDAALAFH